MSVKIQSKADLVNLFTAHRHYKRYLEIGIREGETYALINTPDKVGVDPCPIFRGEKIAIMTSDEFFLSKPEKFDAILVDGDHRYEQVRRDLENSLEFVNENGIILLHDALSTKSSNPAHKTAYIGVWRVVSEIMAGMILKDKAFRIVTLNMDRGTVLIDQIGTYERVPLKFSGEKIGWETFIANTKALLNLVNVEKWVYENA